jgi:uncharacterized protein (DUF58 family)
MYYPDEKENKLKFSVYAAASLIHLLKKQRDAFGLSIFSNEMDFSSSAKSTTAHQKLLISELEKLLRNKNIRKETSAADSLHLIAEQIHKRSLVIIFSDMMDSGGSDELFSALQHLKHNKHEVVLFHTTEKKTEVDFTFEDRPYVFVDTESGEEVKVQANQIRETYLQSMSDFRKALYEKCHQYKIDIAEADIHEGFSQVLSTYLLKRNRML